MVAELYPDPEYADYVRNYISHPPPGFADFRTRVKDGRVIDTLWANVLLSDGTSIGIGRDITGRKRLEAAARESQERLHTILEITKTGIDVIDPEFNLHYVDPGWQKVYGDPTGRKCYEYFMCRDTPCETCGIPRAMETRQITVTEETLPREGNRVVEVRTVPFQDEQGRWLVSKIKSDITERKRTEQALRETQERFLQMAENVGDAFWIVSAEGPATEYVSRAYETIWGRSRQSLYADPFSWIEAVHPDDRERVRRAFKRQPIEGFEEEYRVVRPDGNIRWVHDRGFPVRDASGKLVRIVGIARDVTDRREAEQDARRHQAELAHVARMSTMGEMASGLAHELNQPLTAVVNYAQGALRRLRSGGGADEEVLNALERATEQAHRAAEIIRRLADFVQKHEPRRSTCNFNDAVREVVRFLEADARQHGVRIDLDSSVDLPEILMDNIQIQQVILNLVRNGIEAMSEMTVAERVLGIRTSVVGDAVEVAVRDRGPGLTPEMQERIFTPFYTTKPRGMGMGLPISRSIIDAHGGRLWAACNPDRGATFHFTLPFSAGAPDDEHRSDRLRRG